MRANPDVLAAALDYANRGWSVIPVKGGTKRAVGKWKQFQQAPATREQLEAWFRHKHDALAVVLGDVSGGLLCRDFDVLEAYERWAAEYPELAATLPTVESGRDGGGRHVYCRARGWDVSDVSETDSGMVDFGNGELRGNGHYCVAPPSPHPTGRHYRWVILPGETIPLLDLDATGFVDGGLVTEKTEGTKEDRGTQRTTDAIEGGKGGNGKLFVYTVEQAITDTLPTGPRQRHHLLFEFARALKAVPGLAERPPHELLPHVLEWHRRALPYIRTKEPDETIADFYNGWPRVKYPRGYGYFEEALLAAIRSEIVPEPATVFQDESVRLLAKLCRELQRVNGTAPFYLSCRKAEQSVHLNYRQACRYLLSFEALRMIHCIKRGTAAGQANRYLYLPPLSE